MTQLVGFPGMEYRHLSWQERGYESEQAEVDDMRSYVQHLMFGTEAPDIADTILILANVCENRIIWTQHPVLKQWYTDVAKHLRLVLEAFCIGARPKPNDKFENGYLYMPETESFQ
jgi:hypothetical protein